MLVWMYNYCQDSWCMLDQVWNDQSALDAAGLPPRISMWLGKFGLRINKRRQSFVSYHTQYLNIIYLREFTLFVFSLMEKGESCWQKYTLMYRMIIEEKSFYIDPRAFVYQLCVELCTKYDDWISLLRGKKCQQIDNWALGTGRHDDIISYLCRTLIRYSVLKLHSWK